MKVATEILGCKAKDKVTGFKGVATSVSFDLYGCIQVWLTPQKHGKEKVEGSWFDIKRLQLEKGQPVMPAPVFRLGHENGPEPKAPPRGA